MVPCVMPPAASGQPVTEAHTPVEAAKGHDMGPFSELALKDLVVRRWTLDDGMATESLTDVVRTADGYLWISTYEGLMRFDGLRFESFAQDRLADQLHPHRLAADGFFDLQLDAAGRLWVGGQGGQILHLRDGVFRLIETPIVGPVFDLCFDAAGRLWVAGLNPVEVDPRTDPPTVRAVPGLEGLAMEAVACRGEEVWFGSNAGNVYSRRDDDTWAAHTVGRPIDALASGHDGSLWIGHRRGVEHLQLSPDGQHAVQLDNVLSGPSVGQLLEDARGRLWITSSDGLARRDPDGTLQWLDAKTSGLQEAHSLDVDAEQSLWVAGRVGGLFRFQRGKIDRLDARHGLPTGTVDTLFQLEDGRILVGYDTHLAVIDAQHRIVRYPLPPEVGDFETLDMLQDREGTLWLGGYMGLLRLFSEDQGGGFRLDNPASGFPSSQIRVLHQDSQGTVWVGTDGSGLVELTPNPDGDLSVTVHDSTSGLVSDFVFGIRQARNDHLLFAMRHGFHIRSPDGDLQTFRAGTDFPGSAVFSLLEDRRGDLWIATDRGLTRRRNGRFSTVGTDGGLPSNSLFDLREDTVGGLWMTSTRGLIRADLDALHAYLELPPEERAEPLELDVFDEQDGMPNRQCTGARHVLETQNGELWIPTHGGIAIVDPARLPRHTTPPNVTIERLWVDDVEVEVRGARAQGGLSLPPRPGRYVFDFAVLSLRHPESNAARYRLQGFDKEWRDAGTARRATYTNLPHGRYVFQVRGANADGIWSSEEAQLAFEVQPFFYEHFLFQLAAVITVFLVLSSLIGWRSRIVHRRHRRAQVVSEQRRKLILALQARTDEVNRYLYIFSHDFKNPLHTIKNYSGAVKKDLEKGALDRAERDLKRISDAADALNQQLDDLLKVAEVDRSPTSGEAFAFADIAEAAISYHQETIQRLKVRLNREFEADSKDSPLMLRGNRHRLTEVLIELLGNALKFPGDAQPLIAIGAERQEEHIACWVRDNGPGIDPAYYEKVFQPLTQLDAGTPGTGTGLALVSRVIERHGGKVWLHSTDQGSTTVHFHLPRESGTAVETPR